MSGINRFHSVFEGFAADRHLGAEHKELPTAEKKEQQAAQMIDSFLPAQDDDARAYDIFPGKGQITVPVFQGAGTLTAQYEGDSEIGSAQTSYSNGHSILSRQLYFSESAVDTLELRLNDRGWEETVMATHYHIDRANPEGSYQETQHWHIPKGH
jgi:hypothetical protein